jgi:hypothetical protein
MKRTGLRPPLIASYVEAVAMSYLRWGNKSDWYVFWENSPASAKEDQLLAMWHCDVRERMFSCTYAVVRAMLNSRDFSQIPGYAERYREQIEQALGSFVDDVDLDFARR